MESNLADGLRTLLGADEIVGLTPLSGGASRLTYAFDAVQGGVRRALIVQLARAGSPGAMGGVVTEGALLQAARAAGVPVAEVVSCSVDPDTLGAAHLVMTRVEGETIARKILRDEPFAPARSVLAAEFGRAAAAIHAIEVESVPGLVVQDNLARFRQVWDDMGQASPAFELAFRWLDANRPASPRLTVVHGDLRLGNVIVGPEGLRAVLDWELAHVGDPMEDLGWMCVRAWRFGSALPVAGVGDYEDLFGAYEQASGLPVDRDAVRWWEIMGTLTWGVMCMTQAGSHLVGVMRSHELAAIGRRVCENEYDLLRMLP